MASSNCSSSTFPEILQSEAFLETSHHVMTSLGLPIHIFGAYCILLKSPKEMSHMKGAMINLHIWSVALDIGIGFLFIPFLLLPALAGVGLGLFSYFGLDLAAQTLLGMCLLGAVMMSVAVLFETRFYLLYADKSSWKWIRKPWILVHYIVAFTCLIPSYLMVPEQKSAKVELLEYIPCLPRTLLEDRFLVVTVHRTFTVLNIMVMIVPVLFETFLFVMLINWNMRKMQKLARLSEKTLKLQRKFQRALVYQVTLPVVNLIAPICYYLYSLHFHYYNQGFNNIIMIFISLHGMASSLVTILIHKPYRETLLVMLRGAKVSGSQTLIEVSATVN